MQLKERIREDIWRLAFALIIPPLLMMLPFMNSPVFLKHFVYAFIPYSFFSLSVYIVAIKKEITSFLFFIGSGLAGGFISGIIFVLVTSIVIGSFETSTTRQITNIFSLGIKVGLYLSFFFSYVFWSFVINRKIPGIINKIISIVLLLFFITLPLSAILAD